jgi:hypothetical protein
MQAGHWVFRRRRAAACALLGGVFAMTPCLAERLYLSLAGPSPAVLWVVESGSPPEVSSGVLVTGLTSGEQLMGIAVRPKTGVLYGLGSTGRVYTIEPASGAASAVGAPAFAPAPQGNKFGVSFDPVHDRLRVVSATGQNLLLDPTSGLVVNVGSTLAFAAGDAHFGKVPQVGAIAYRVDPSGSATLFGVDASSGALVRIGNPDPADGSLRTEGSPGPGPVFGLDVSRKSGTAYGVTPGFTPAMLNVDLTGGAGTLFGPIGGQFTFFTGLAVAPAAVVDVPALSPAFLVLFAGFLALAGARLARLGRR